MFDQLFFRSDALQYHCQLAGFERQRMDSANGRWRGAGSPFGISAGECFGRVLRKRCPSDKGGEQPEGPTFDPEILRIRTKSSAAAWRRFRTKVRSSFCTLKSYLSSGKSCAMAMSLFPMSFHLSTISSERERAELGGWFCVWARP